LLEYEEGDFLVLEQPATKLKEIRVTSPVLIIFTVVDFIFSLLLSFVYVKQILNILIFATIN
jgi:hypothetical protein